MKIVVFRTDKLGDFITALPAIYVLKNHSDVSHVSVVVSPINEDLAKSCTFIDEVIIDDPKSSLFQFVKKLKSSKFDASITLFSNIHIGLAQFLAAIPKRIAPATKIAQIFYNKKISQHRSQVKMAEFEYNLELTKALFSDIDISYPQPLLKFQDSNIIYKDFCSKNNITKDVVAFHVGFGGSSDANLNIDEYEILIRELVDRKKYQIVLTFGPDEKELCENMKKRLAGKDIVYYFSCEGLVYFAKIISNFKLFVSTSTGTYHIASSVGVPTCTFFADTLFASALRWKSIGDINLQMHFMLPQEKEKKAIVFQKIKEKLLTF